jgi:hypothetical protein
MGETFTVVVVGAIALFALIGVVSWLSGASVYDEISQGGFSGGSGDGAGGLGGGAPPAPLPDSPAARAEQEMEIRQMLQARSDRRMRRGEQPLDVEAELAKLQEQAGDQEGSAKRDTGLVEEVRQLVTARNERRARRGEPPLDVEAEVERTLAELEP